MEKSLKYFELEQVTLGSYFSIFFHVIFGNRMKNTLTIK